MSVFCLAFSTHNKEKAQIYIGNKKIILEKSVFLPSDKKIIPATQKDCKPPIYLCNVKRK
ncbi:hypothetical protein EVA_02863 [gut metagenome]|uniref:Uncharacterized protein n=1 Tax=gut metagenome TaxID=749906 RepID=J9GM65_9ZZZZ